MAPPSRQVPEAQPGLRPKLAATMIEPVVARIQPYTVPAIGTHWIDLWGDPLAVACNRFDAVEFWAADVVGAIRRTRLFIVRGTGEAVGANWRHWGSALLPSGNAAWHLLEILNPAQPEE